VTRLTLESWGTFRTGGQHDEASCDGWTYRACRGSPDRDGLDPRSSDRRRRDAGAEISAKRVSGTGAPKEAAHRRAPVGRSGRQPGAGDSTGRGAAQIRGGTGDRQDHHLSHHRHHARFSTNYIVIGELATAAGLSTFNLVAGPLFYFAHEAVWNYLGHPESRAEVPQLAPSEENAQQVGIAGFTISRALAKTITFRTIATVMDFTTNYVVVGNFAQAVLLSATGFVLGPFVYYGHEKAWEYFGERAADAAAEPKLLPAPA
jgi:uncharacterized membrane protein